MVETQPTPVEGRRERKKREIDPLHEALRELRAERATTSPAIERVGRLTPSTDPVDQRLDSMLEFIEMIDSISNRLISSGKGLELAAKILAKAS